jgi:hypothetical protein
MARHKNANWNCGEDGGTVSQDQARLAVLMDIRDELQALNRIMQCSNVRDGFIAMQHIDKRMQRNGMLLYPPRKRKRP